MCLLFWFVFFWGGRPAKGNNFSSAGFSFGSAYIRCVFSDGLFSFGSLAGFSFGDAYIRRVFSDGLFSLGSSAGFSFGGAYIRCVFSDGLGFRV